jgi:hypothetical protein
MICSLGSKEQNNITTIKNIFDPKNSDLDQTQLESSVISLIKLGKIS